MPFPRHRLPALGALLALYALSACDTAAPPPFNGAGGDAKSDSGDAIVLAGVCQPDDREFCQHQGHCDARGAGCVCDDPTHYTPDDDCRNWHQHVSSVDTPCAPDDRDYCNSSGACASDGETCVCDDPDHYLASERCSTWHQTTVEPEPGQRCVPETTELCHNNGVCGSDGLGCVCDDPQHYLPADDCNTWYQSTEVPDPEKRCVPDSPALCHDHGVCAADGMGCVCEDPEHYRPDDDCNTWYQSSDVPTNTHTCEPGSTYTCHGHGACGEDGKGCVCDDPAHYTPSDDCNTWYQDAGG